MSATDLRETGPIHTQAAKTQSDVRTVEFAGNAESFGFSEARLLRGTPVGVLLCAEAIIRVTAAVVVSMLLRMYLAGLVINPYKSRHLRIYNSSPVSLYCVGG